MPWVTLPELRRHRLRQLLAQLMARTLLAASAQEDNHD
jgi:hypothetical protein